MKITGLRWLIIGLIALSTVINFIDRSAINIMWPYIYKEFGIADADSKNALALITTFFLIAYATGQTVFGKIMDRVGTRLGMVYAIVGWSVSITLHAISRTLFYFNIFRFMLGFNEAGNWPGATKSNAEWFPPSERAIAQGIFGGSTAVGSIIAGPVISFLFVALGWRLTFVAIALLGLLWVIPWLIINKGDPNRHPWITDAERQRITTTKVEMHVVPETSLVYINYTWRELLKFKNTWGIILGRFFIDPAWWLFITWLPTFLKEQFKFDIKQIAAFSWFPYLLAALGGLCGGYFALRSIRSGRSALRTRKIAISIGCAVMLFALLLLSSFLEQLSSKPEMVMLLIGSALFGFQHLISNLQTLPSDYYQGSNVGTVAGMAGSAAVLGTLITTWLVPMLTKTSYTAFFILGSTLVPMAWCAIIFIRSTNRQNI